MKKFKAQNKIGRLLTGVCILHADDSKYIELFISCLSTRPRAGDDGVTGHPAVQIQRHLMPVCRPTTTSGFLSATIKYTTITMTDLKALPDDTALAAASDLEVFDINGDKVKFGSIFEKQKTVVVFISMQLSVNSTLIEINNS